MSHHDAFHSEHEEVWELLPWHINGTLEGRDARRVERHLGHCLPCHAELGRQRELASLVQAPEALPLSPGHGLARLEGRLAASRRLTARRPLGWGWLALAEAAIIVVLLSAVLARRQPPALPQATFETLGNAAPALDRASGPVYRALFAESASERELRELLAGLNLRIVDGPSPLGLFTLELAAETQDPRTPAAVLAGLRAHDAVRFAERIDQPSAPQGD
jgi:hypothetical protein